MNEFLIVAKNLEVKELKSAEIKEDESAEFKQEETGTESGTYELYTADVSSTVKANDSMKIEDGTIMRRRITVWTTSEMSVLSVRNTVGCVVWQK